MQAFHNDKAIKAKYVNRIIAHRKADNLIRGKGWENGKGCAVGCTLENYNHLRYETELGIPEWLARVEDTLFEGMSEKKSRTWPELFLKAIPVGVDLEPVKAKFLVAVLKHTLKSMKAAKYDAEKFPDVKKAFAGSTAAVKQMIAAQESGDADKIASAGSAAWSARSAAGSAAESARSAWSAGSAAWSAARSAGLAAESAAESAESAAWSAAWSAWSAAWSAGSAAWSAARSVGSAGSAAYDFYADELLKILKRVK